MYTPRDGWITNYADLTKFEMERQTKTACNTSEQGCKCFARGARREANGKKSKTDKRVGFPVIGLKMSFISSALTYLGDVTCIAAHKSN